MSEATSATMERGRAAADPVLARKQRSLWADSWQRLWRNPGAVVGAIILGVLVLAALLAPYIARYDPVVITPADRLQPPNWNHWFGTDAFGRDIFTRVIYGGRISLQVGIVSVLIGMLIGVTLGMIAGYFGRMTDSLIMRMIDILLAFPGILLALAIIAVLGSSLTNVMIAVGIGSIPTFARVARGTVLQSKSEMFVEAAAVVGASTGRILTRHILPNILGPLVVIATLGVAGAIIAGAALSFLGLGAEPPTPEWGLMLSDGRNYLRQAWWITTFPGVAIMITVLSINLLGDGLRDALDPKMKR